MFPLEGIPEVEEGDDLGALLAAAADGAGGLEDGDVVVVAQKVVSKAEGRVVGLAEVEPVGARARARRRGPDPRHVEVILRETARVVRSRPPLVIAETRHGFICASAGVDASNAPGCGTLVLLPLDPDASAARLRAAAPGADRWHVGVIVSDSFGRPWRQGTTDVALGAAGVPALLDLRGRATRPATSCSSTQIAVADEIAGAAELVLGKTRGVPAAIVRGFEPRATAAARELVMPAERDLFR